MKTFCIVLIVGLASCGVQGNVLSLGDKKCPDICPALYSPVCGTNGEIFTEFGNQCIMDTANCHLQRGLMKPYKQAESVWCKTQLADNLNTIVGNLNLDRPECMKACTMIYAPICAANSKYRATVASQCILEVYNCVLRLEDSKADFFEIIKQDAC